MATENMDPEKFCEEVDKIESLIKGMSSTDEIIAKEATKKADELIALQEKKIIKSEKKKYPVRDNTGVNRTVINQKAFDELGHIDGPNITPEMDQAGFMAVMEQDAKERQVRRKRDEKEATSWKEKGNEEFKNGNYEKAVEHYSKALSIFKDTTVLWTNRAQAYIKLGEYEKALSDCDWATRVFENCLKAYFHRGKAYLGLKQYDKAIESYERAKEIEPQKHVIINNYIKEVELAQRTEEQEAMAKEFQEKGGWQAEGLVETLKKLYKTDQLPQFYCGGLMILQKMKDNNERTLFRTEGGMNIITEHPVISRCLKASPRSLSREELDICAATFATLTAACVENEENQKVLMENPELTDRIMKFLETSVKKTQFLKESAISLLLAVSESEIGRTKMVTNFDLSKLVPCLFKLMMYRGLVGMRSACILNNLAIHKKFKKVIKEDVDLILPAFCNLMTEGPKNPSVLPTCVSTVTNLCSDEALRKHFINSRETWQACVDVLKSHLATHQEKYSSDVLFSLLGFFSNLTYDKSFAATTNSTKHIATFQNILCDQCFKFLKDTNELRLQERSLLVLGHILPQASEAVNSLCEEKAVVTFLDLLRTGEEALVKGCIKCLAACSQYNEKARVVICHYHSGTLLIQKLLQHSEDSVVGNAALCLDNCCTVPGMASNLTGSSIIMDLLVLARDGKQKGVQKNCAILIAKLCKADNKHLEKLRELDGLGILHNLMGKVVD